MNPITKQTDSNAKIPDCPDGWISCGPCDRHYEHWRRYLAQQPQAPKTKAMTAREWLTKFCADRGLGTKGMFTFKGTCDLADAFAAQRCAELERERDEAWKEIKRLILQYTVAHSYWYDGDAHFDSPEEYADEQNLKVGDEFELDASTYWEEKFRVTKVPDETSDDYECETISKKREEFETYQEMEARCKTAESRAREREEQMAKLVKSRDEFGQAALNNRVEIENLEETLRQIAALPLGHHDAKRLALAVLRKEKP